jgi:hypothetical protein
MYGLFFVSDFVGGALPEIKKWTEILGAQKSGAPACSVYKILDGGA